MYQYFHQWTIISLAELYILFSPEIACVQSALYWFKTRINLLWNWNNCLQMSPRYQCRRWSWRKDIFSSPALWIAPGWQPTFQWPHIIEPHIDAFIQCAMCVSFTVPSTELLHLISIDVLVSGTCHQVSATTPEFDRTANLLNPTNGLAQHHNIRYIWSLWSCCLLEVWKMEPKSKIGWTRKSVQWL